MREEPVIYINGNPYVVREANKPFANLEYTGGDLRKPWLNISVNFAVMSGMLLNEPKHCSKLEKNVCL